MEGFGEEGVPDIPRAGIKVYKTLRRDRNDKEMTDNRGLGASPDKEDSRIIEAGMEVVEGNTHASWPISVRLSPSTTSLMASMGASVLLVLVLVLVLILVLVLVFILFLFLLTPKLLELEIFCQNLKHDLGKF